MSAFNVDAKFAEQLSFPKQTKPSDLYAISCIEGAFNAAANSAELYLEFDGQIRESVLIKRFEDLGACSVDPLTFGNGGGHEAAANAIERVRRQGNTTGGSFRRGAPTATVLSIITARSTQAQSAAGGGEGGAANGSSSRAENAEALHALKDIHGDLYKTFTSVEGVHQKVDHLQSTMHTTHNAVAGIEETMGKQTESLAAVGATVVQLKGYESLYTETLAKLNHKTREVKLLLKFCTCLVKH